MHFRIAFLLLLVTVVSSSSLGNNNAVNEDRRSSAILEALEQYLAKRGHDQELEEFQDDDIDEYLHGKAEDLGLSDRELNEELNSTEDKRMLEAFDKLDERALNDLLDVVDATDLGEEPDERSVLNGMEKKFLYSSLLAVHPDLREVLGTDDEALDVKARIFFGWLKRLWERVWKSKFITWLRRFGRWLACAICNHKSNAHPRWMSWGFFKKLARRYIRPAACLVCNSRGK